MDPLNTTCPSPAENPHIFDLSSSYGAILIGSSISSAFWGVSSLQTSVQVAGLTLYILESTEF